MILTYKDLLYKYRVVYKRNKSKISPERRVKLVCGAWNRRRSFFNGYENI